jgi:hypothetical protein
MNLYKIDCGGCPMFFAGKSAKDARAQFEVIRRAQYFKLWPLAKSAMLKPAIKPRLTRHGKID